MEVFILFSLLFIIENFKQLKDIEKFLKSKYSVHKIFLKF